MQSLVITLGDMCFWRILFLMQNSSALAVTETQQLHSNKVSFTPEPTKYLQISSFTSWNNNLKLNNARQPVTSNKNKLKSDTLDRQEQ